MNIEVKFRSYHPNAQRPQQATPGSAGFDLVSAAAFMVDGGVIVDTKIATAFSSDYVMLVFGRSGYARKYGICLVNGVGVIDADYRGTTQLCFKSHLLTPYQMMEHLEPGNRVAQAIFMPALAADWVEQSELPDSIRGDGGFGSTGS